jgi:flagellar biosynthesis/type III secretory pathway protein FliH
MDDVPAPSGVGPLSRRIPAPLWDATSEARRRLDDAVAEARSIVETARAEADAIRAAAAAAGRDEGLATACEVVARASLEADRLLAGAKAQVVELAFAIAGRVLARAAESDPRVVVESAERALEAVRRRAEVVVRVHPQDLAALQAEEPGLAGRLTRARGLRLAADDAVERGGVVVETEAGSVDATFAAQLDGLRRALATAAQVRPA